MVVYSVARLLLLLLLLTLTLVCIYIHIYCTHTLNWGKGRVGQ